jgi:hypothetical protein
VQRPTAGMEQALWMEGSRCARPLAVVCVVCVCFACCVGLLWRVSDVMFACATPADAAARD